MGTVKVSTLIEFIEWSTQFNPEQYMFRGVSKKSYDIEASTYQPLRRQTMDEFSELVRVNEELIKEARLRGHDQKDGKHLSDLELLAELQHFGAATCLIDFTYNSLIALWFACQQSTSSEQEDGRVVVLRYDDELHFERVTHDLMKENISYFFQGDTFYFWQPSHQNRRIIAQQSVFVFGGRMPKIEADDECIVIESKKGDIRESLANVSDVTEAYIYPDFEGFARLHARDRSIRNLTVQEYLQLSHQEITAAMTEMRSRHNQGVESSGLNIGTHPNSLDRAISYCNRIIKMVEDGAIQADNLTIARVYYTRGFAYSLIGNVRINDAIADYGKAIELNPSHSAAYFSRGLMRVDEGEWAGARADFTAAITLGFPVARYFNELGGMQILNPSIIAELPEDIRLLLTQPETS